MQHLRYRAHGPVANQDAVNRTQVRYFSSSAGKERFIADVQHLARQRLLDNRNAKMAREYQ